MAPEPREPKTTATRQFSGLVLAPVHPEKLEALRTLLEKIAAETMLAMQGQGVPAASLPFDRLETVHFARLVLIDWREGMPVLLAFSTNYDGPEGEDRVSARRALEHHIEDLVNNAGAGLEQVFECCTAYQPGRLAAFLRENQRSAATFYVGSTGRSRNQILWEAKLRRKIDAIIDGQDFRSTPAKEVRAKVLAQLKTDYPNIPSFPPQPDLTNRVTAVRNGAFVLGGAWLAATIFAFFAGLQLVAWSLAGALLGLVVLAALLAWRLRHLEKSDRQFQPEYSEDTVDEFRKVSVEENIFLQNQLTHFVRIKPGLFRWLLIRAVFVALQFLAKYKYNKGKLGEIPSIHFGRWVLLPNRGVLFFSNFDSSWQSYLGDFIDQASAGLTAVWSNTEQYPRTTWLLEAGSRDAARFLAWTRHNQHPTQVWYSAYPGLSIVNINANTELRRGLDPKEDAVTWLFQLRGVDRLAADQIYSDQRTHETTLPMRDIQGIVLWGYGHMPESRFLLFRVARTGPELLSWLSKLPLSSAEGSKTDEPPEPLINVAFTYRGLRALGIDKMLCDRFSTPFVQGSDDEYRARVNGDVGDDAPDSWSWGGPKNPVDLVLLVYGATKESAASFATGYVKDAELRGLQLVENLEGTTLSERKEHFGFRDGIAQPMVQGSGRGEIEGNTVAAGEFLLGHPDGYGNISHSPLSSAGFAFGMNGTYLVFRQLEQHVESFWQYCSAQRGADAINVASKMVGRWPSGAPLVRHPNSDPNNARFQDEDTFNYLANDEDNDRYGARCPFGAHIRRANPRDWQVGTTPEESLRLSNLHRILRRGRPYGAPLVASMDAKALIDRAMQTPAAGIPESRGLQFLCFNANIERQFEFIQQQWFNNPKFAGQNSGADPLLGMRQKESELGTDAASFTIQSDVKLGLGLRATPMKKFVRVVGSAYFFMPSIPAVRLLRGDIGKVSPADALETIPADEQLHIDSLRDVLREKMKEDYAGMETLRDAHPKMHGCVRALFKVEEGLDARFQVGLFKKARTYQAYVRFSNADRHAQEDGKKDIRGVAIKLLGVDEPVLLDGAEDCGTHDLLLISHDCFVARDVAEFDALVHALLAGNVALARFALGHPRAALKALGSVARHSSPLEIQYFSAVPYLFGDRAVKYSLKPSSDEKSAIPQPPPRDYLRAAMKKRLGAGSASFDFLVQARGDPKKMPIEDSTVPWTSDFQKAATLELLAEDFDTAERDSFGENLSFNPWRCLPEHRPLGGINRARRQIYRALSSFRHDRNTAPNQEPVGW